MEIEWCTTTRPEYRQNQKSETSIITMTAHIKLPALKAGASGSDEDMFQGMSNGRRRGLNYIRV